MSHSKNLGVYDDIRRVLDTAIEHQGGRYRLSNYKAAVRWRSRAYMFRKLLYDVLVEQYKAFPGRTASTPYDGLLLRLEPGESGGHYVTIQVGVAFGDLYTLEDKRITYESMPTPAPTDTLLNEAEEFLEVLKRGEG